MTYETARAAGQRRKVTDCFFFSENQPVPACPLEHETGWRGNNPPAVVSWLQEEIESAS